MVGVYMTFAELRRTVLRNGPLSSSWFGESVVYRDRSGVESTIQAKIEVDGSDRRERRDNRSVGQRAVDEMQRIRVLVSRETNWSGAGISSTPLVGGTITRTTTADPDQRPYTYAGEIAAYTSQFAVFIFERARRQYDDRRYAQG